MTTQNDSIFGSSIDAFRVDQEGRRHSFAGTSIQCIMLFPDVHVDVRKASQPNVNGLFAPNDIIQTETSIINKKSPANLIGDHYKYFAELQTISISSAMSTYPVRSLGKKTADTYLKGARCIPASEKVLVKDKGYISIKDVSAGDYVHSDINQYNKVLATTNDGEKLCYKINLKSGYCLTASYDHPIFTDRGKINMEDLTIKDRVYVCGKSPCNTEDFEISDDILKLIAYIIGDGFASKYKKKFGNYEHRIGIAIANTQIDTIGAETAEILKRLKIPFKDYNQEGCFSRFISCCIEGFAKTDWRKREYNVLHKYLIKYDMYSKKANEKFIPNELIANLSERQIALFLNRLFSTDGCYSKDTKQITAMFSSVSEELIDGIRILLNKLGINSTKRKEKKEGLIGGRKEIVSNYNSYTIRIKKASDLFKFIKKINIFSKENIVSDSVVDKLISQSKSILNIDRNSFAEKVKDIKTKKNIKSKKLTQLLYHAEYNNLPIFAKRAKKIANILGDDSFNKYVDNLIIESIFAENEWLLTPIKSIEQIGYLPIYDLEVEDRHHFICNFIKVSNTWAGSMVFTVLDKDVLYEAAKLYNPYTTNKYSYDDIPPFDIIINATNEYGQVAYKVISQVVLSHGGEVYSIDDIFLEQTQTYQAKHVTPFMSMDSINEHLIGSQFSNMITPRDLMDANRLLEKAGQIYKDKTSYYNSNNPRLRESLGQIGTTYKKAGQGYTYENTKTYEQESYADRIRNYILKTEGGAGPKL